MSDNKRKSYILNIQFLLGLLIFVGYIVVIFIYNVKRSNVNMHANSPLAKPAYLKLFFGTDSNGNSILNLFLKATLSDAFIILGAWFISLIFSIPLGFLSSKKKWLGSGIKDILGFGPSIVIACILIYVLKIKIYGLIIATGIGLIPYMIVKFSNAFEEKQSGLVYYYIIHGIFISVIIVQISGFLGLYQSKISLGGEIYRNINYAMKYPYLILPYFISSFLFIIGPSLMLRGIKNAHVKNNSFDIPEIISKETSEEISTESKDKDSNMAVNKDEISNNIELNEEELKQAAQAYSEADIAEYFKNCLRLSQIERKITEYMVFELNYSHAALFKVFDEGYKLISLHKKTVPRELIDINEENENFQEKAYKFLFLETLKSKTNSYFLYPGKDKYDRIFHHLIVNGKVGYILEVSYNKELSDENIEVNKLRKFIPEAEWQILMLEQKLEEIEKTGDEKSKVSEAKPHHDEEIGRIERTKEGISDEGQKALERIGKVLESEDLSGKKYYKVVKQDGRVIREGDNVEELIKKDEKFIKDKGLIPVDEDIPEAIEEKDYDKASITSKEQRLNQNDVYLDFDIESEIEDTEIKIDKKIKLTLKDELNLDEEANIFYTKYENKLNLGLKYLQEKDYNNAVSFLKEAVALEPHSYNAYMGLGHVYREKKLYGEALEYYKKAINQDKFSASAYYYIGNVLYSTGNYEVALESWQKAYNLDPGRVLIKKNIEKLKKIIDKSS